MIMASTSILAVDTILSQIAGDPSQQSMLPPDGGIT
jgi:hypothetical protein